MKSIINSYADKINKRFLALVLLVISLNGFSQLSGIYTIGEGQDYETFTSAATALRDNGINGAVIFNVMAGTYTEQPVFSNISGVSEENTILFQSQNGDSTSVILQFESTVLDSNWVVKIDNVSFIGFKSMTFKALASQYYGRNIELVGNIRDISFTNNEFYGLDANDANSRYIILNYSKRFAIDEILLNITIKNNKFYKGSSAIFLIGDNNKFITGTEITNNTFVETGYACVNVQWNLAPVVTNNKMDSKTNGIFASGNLGAGVFSYNHIQSNYQGMEIRRYGVPYDVTLICNNFVSVGEGGLYGINIQNSIYTDVYYNSVYMNSNSISSSAFYSANGVDETPTVNVRNNNFVHEKRGYAALVVTPGVLASMDHNNLYTAGNYISRWNYDYIINLEDLQDSSGINSNSFSFYPNYISENDLHTLSPWLNNKGVPITEINNDFDGDMRDIASPDIGADEFTPDPLSVNPLNGSYTIGAGGDYPTLSAAFDDALLKGTQDGITFLLLEGKYEEQVVIKSIPGAGANSRIIIDCESRVRDSTVISYSCNNSDENYVIKLQGADFITIQNLTLKSMGERYARAIDLWQGADHVEITGNHIVTTNKTGNAPDNAAIYSDDSDYHERCIMNNIIKGGAYGLYMRRNQNNVPLAKGAIIKNNTITENGYTGIYLQYYDAPIVEENTVKALSNGIIILMSSNNAIVNKNKIEVTSDMGIQLSSCMATEAYRGIVANNFIFVGGSSGKAEGIYINNSSNFLIANNSVHLASTNSSSKAFYTTSNNSNLSLLNNIFAHTGGGYAYYVTNPDNVIKSDYNNLYTTGDNVGFWTANIIDLSALQNASGMEEHSLSVDPQFYTNNDLHISADVLDSAGLSLSEVADDIDGEPRDLNYPDIGADEIGNGLNSLPIALNDTLLVSDEIIIYPLLNDFDPDGDKIVISELFAPVQGVASVMVGDTTIRYTPFLQPSQSTDTIRYVISDAHYAKDTACVIISLSSVGINLNENGYKNSFTIFPNPAKNWLTVYMNRDNEHGMFKFIIYTILGNKISEEIYFYNNLQNTVNLNVIQLPAGIYILTIENEGSITSKKFIKE